MPNLTTSICGSCVKVKFSWNNPGNNNGAAINRYDIKIKAKNGQFYASPECDGLDPIIIAARACYVFMTSLRAAPFSLVANTGIVAYVNGANLKGYNNSYSMPNIATNVIETVPVSPTGSRNRPPTTFNLMQIALT
jgi:hypothetical protein